MPELLPARLARLPSHALDGELVVFEAATALARLRGLAGLRALPVDVGLLLPRTRSVHTIGMRFALDLVWLGRDGVVRVDREVAPWRQRTAWRARQVVELPAGRADAFLLAGLSSWRA
ncbi:DUF192 domain-containing protein [Baekduia sp. Peel2402]|uniref:DUF192 domain-containing protein n=1 Tax=Baekduia sp. Peel2402 TaxID=3458296 RepID=UPI00403EADE3